VAEYSLIGCNILLAENSLVGENILYEGYSVAGENALSLIADGNPLPCTTLVGDRTLGVDSSLGGENTREQGTSLVGENTLVGERVLVGHNSLVGEKILEGESVLDGDKDVGDITLARGGILDAVVGRGDLPVTPPTALLAMPDNVLLAASALSGIPPVVDARFIGRSRGLFRGWTVELVGKALLLSTIPAPNRELPGNIFQMPK
jgi:hypothetical protein